MIPENAEKQSISFESSLLEVFYTKRFLKSFQKFMLEPPKNASITTLKMVKHILKIFIV